MTFSIPGFGNIEVEKKPNVLERTLLYFGNLGIGNLSDSSPTNINRLRKFFGKPQKVRITLPQVESVFESLQQTTQQLCGHSLWQDCNCSRGEK